jgi:hypothetical protein
MTLREKTNFTHLEQSIQEKTDPKHDEIRWKLHKKLVD